MCAKRLKHIEEVWKSTTDGANTLFNQGQFEKSLVGYARALSSAEILNNYMEDAMKMGMPSLRVFVISCNNMAFTYEKLDRLEEGLICLKERFIFF